MSNIAGSETGTVQAGDARALQQQLYRQIGLSAVAEALKVDLPTTMTAVSLVEPAAPVPHVIEKVAA